MPKTNYLQQSEARNLNINLKLRKVYEIHGVFRVLILLHVYIISTRFVTLKALNSDVGIYST